MLAQDLQKKLFAPHHLAFAHGVAIYGILRIVFKSDGGSVNQFAIYRHKRERRMTAMPMLMEKNDWTRTISSFGNVNRVWREDVSGGTGVVPLSLPGLGPYRVYIVEVGDKRRLPENVPSGVLHDWHDIPVSPLVEEITGIIPDENPTASYRDILSDAICDKYLTGS